MSNRRITSRSRFVGLRLPRDLDAAAAARLAPGASLTALIVAALRAQWGVPEPVAGRGRGTTPTNDK